MTQNLLEIRESLTSNKMGCKSPDKIVEAVIVRYCAHVILMTVGRRFEELKMRRARRAMIKAAQYKIDFEYKYHVNVLEKRLERYRICAMAILMYCRLENIISSISPLLLSQSSDSWIDKYNIRQDTKKYDKNVLPYSYQDKENLHNKTVNE